MLVDYANDFICALRCKQDAENFMLEQEKRFKRFGLELSKYKIKPIPSMVICFLILSLS